MMNTEHDTERDVVTWVRSNSCQSATSSATNHTLPSRKSNL